MCHGEVMRDGWAREKPGEMFRLSSNGRRRKSENRTFNLFVWFRLVLYSYLRRTVCVYTSRHGSEMKWNEMPCDRTELSQSAIEIEKKNHFATSFDLQPKCQLLDKTRNIEAQSTRLIYPTAVPLFTPMKRLDNRFVRSAHEGSNYDEHFIRKFEVSPKAKANKAKFIQTENCVIFIYFYVSEKKLV